MKEPGEMSTEATASFRFSRSGTVHSQRVLLESLLDKLCVQLALTVHTSDPPLTLLMMNSLLSSQPHAQDISPQPS